MEQGVRIRTVILLWFLLSGVSSLQAQLAGDIDTLSQWRVDFEMANSYGVVYDHFKYFIDGDTVIGATEYYKVYKSGYSYEYEFSSHDTSEYYFYERKYSVYSWIKDLSLLQHDSEESQAWQGKDMLGRNPTPSEKIILYSVCAI